MPFSFIGPFVSVWRCFGWARCWEEPVLRCVTNTSLMNRRTSTSPSPTSPPPATRTLITRRRISGFIIILITTCSNDPLIGHKSLQNLPAKGGPGSNIKWGPGRLDITSKTSSTMGVSGLIVEPRITFNPRHTHSQSVKIRRTTVDQPSLSTPSYLIKTKVERLTFYFTDDIWGFQNLCPYKW